MNMDLRVCQNVKDVQHFIGVDYNFATDRPFMIYANDECVGVFELFKEEDKRVVFQTFVVGSEFRSKSYGSWAFQLAMQMTQQSGEAFMYFRVAESNWSVMPFYDKFHPIRTGHYTKTNPIGVEFVVYCGQDDDRKHHMDKLNTEYIQQQHTDKGHKTTPPLTLYPIGALRSPSRPQKHFQCQTQEK